MDWTWPWSSSSPQKPCNVSPFPPIKGEQLMQSPTASPPASTFARGAAACPEDKATHCVHFSTFN